MTTRALPMTAEERRASIVEATVPLVRQHGRAVTTRQIAAAAGIAEGTIFRVFPDKATVIDAVVSHELDEQPMLVRLAEIDRDAPLTDRLLATAEVMRERMRRVTQLTYLLYAGAGPTARGPSLERGGSTMRRDGSAVRAHLVRMLQPDADRLSVDVEKAAALAAGLLWATSRSVLDPVGEPVSSADVVNLLLHGIYRPDTDTKSDTDTRGT